MKLKLKRSISATGKALTSVQADRKDPIIFTACSILGIVIGVICETINSDVYTTIGVAYADYLDKAKTFSFFSLVLNSVSYNVLFLFSAMLLGLCTVGYNFLYAVPFFKGLGIGCVSGYLYCTYALKGVFYCAVLIFPSSLIQLTAIIISCSEAYLMSKDILMLLNKKGKENAEIEVNLYILRFFVLAVIMLLSCFLYAMMNKLFVRIQ